MQVCSERGGTWAIGKVKVLLLITKVPSFRAEGKNFIATKAQDNTTQRKHDDTGQDNTTQQNTTQHDITRYYKRLAHTLQRNTNPSTQHNTTGPNTMQHHTANSQKI
uniref:Uncharacterized protein n=1 Tax=Eutreptiella gymnastica TaxID=73025 RepID=A0A7S4CCF4_9EUGL|mmetsp:Transcript_53521/g.89045  ORF Transcript_53521/g.89045 Transcript_53521/m.89045 type:complete len:107 (-) Transcript_53521:297-617(-)